MKIYIIKNPTQKDYKKQLLNKYALNIGYTKEIILLKQDLGKPYIKDNPFYFNISHSYDYYIMACSHHEVGIDIEKHRSIYQKIVNNYFDEEEKHYIQKHQEKGFFDIWCQKESYAKINGKSIFTLIKEPLHLKDYYDNCYFKEIFIDDHYSCFVAMSQNSSITLEYIDNL